MTAGKSVFRVADFLSVLSGNQSTVAPIMAKKFLSIGPLLEPVAWAEAKILMTFVCWTWKYKNDFLFNWHG